MTADREPLEYGKAPKRCRWPSKWEWLVIPGIIALLVSILLPIIERERFKHATPRCVSNLRQIGQAIQLYIHDNNRTAYPPDLATAVSAYPFHPSGLVCPESNETLMKGRNVAGNTANLLHGHCSYIYVGRDLTTKSSPDCVVAFEDPANHGMEGAYVLFTDGHVDYLGIGMANFVSELEQGYNPPRQSTQSVAQLRAMYDRDWKPKLAAMKSGQWAQRLPPPRTATTTPIAGAGQGR